MDTTLFADDACFNLAHNNPCVLEQLVNLELEKIGHWFNDNKLAINTDKTHFILIHRKSQKINIHLKLNGSQLLKKDQITYLGVIIDEKLNWKPHVLNCTTKLNRCLWAITKLRPYANTRALKMVYYSLAYPFIQYCVSSWGGACPTTLQPLLAKQKCIIKSILFQDYTASSSPLFLKLGLLKLNEIYRLQIAKLMFNQIKNNNIICQNLSPVSEPHSYSTRSSHNLDYCIPRVKSNLGKTSFQFCGPLVWNSLPNEIKSSSIFQFKMRLKKHLLNSYLPPAL